MAFEAKSPSESVVAELGEPPLVGHSPSEVIEHYAHLLPTQGPITVFVHHNTLHAFEDRPFEQAVLEASDLYDCHPYLPEAEYRAEVERGRIRPGDLELELIDVFGDDGETMLGNLGTVHALWHAMLGWPLCEGTDPEIHWFLDSAGSLHRYRADVPATTRNHTIAQTRRWMLRDYLNVATGTKPWRDEIERLVQRFGRPGIEGWDEATWEAFTLQLLWHACRSGVGSADDAGDEFIGSALRTEPGLGQLARARTLTAPELIRYCAAFLDQGLAGWRLPDRDQGFWKAFVSHFSDAKPVDPWLRRLPAALRELSGLRIDAVLERLLHEVSALLGIDAEQHEELLLGEMLALRGWAGMLWQMETAAQWTPRPAPPGTLVEYVALRLLMLREALRYEPEQRPPANDPAAAGAPSLTRAPTPLLRAFLVFQIAQVRGWTPMDLLRQSPREWKNLLNYVESFPSRERRRVFHQAYERRLRESALDSLRGHAARIGAAGLGATTHPPAFQAVCCIDEREESFRRALEEVEPACETFGFAGFFGVAMYYRGVSEARYRPLCPVNVQPTHYVCEGVTSDSEQAGRLQAIARRAIGHAARHVNEASHSFLGGAVAALVGPITTVPLVLRVLMPRQAGLLLKTFGRAVLPRRTRLTIEREAEQPGDADDALGYSVAEMADIVFRTLRTIGLMRGMSRLVVIVGHGSTSLNNPHAAAYDCGACGGGRGGPNARGLAWMANDPRVRDTLKSRGVVIDDSTHFLGAEHDTGNDSVKYFDVDLVPESHRSDLERVRDTFDQARALNALERCRRFESAPLSLSPEMALRHVEGRAADLSQARPECGHATNAFCLVGRRSWSRGLFLDRRAFLASYDPACDDADASVLAGLLGAVVPVCGGINLEYYFSRIDNRGYGCGVKLPHNITSLLGVMDGAGSDLRTGLPWQMVEIHEPVRILFVVESTPETLLSILQRNPLIDTLVRGNWVQLATFDPHSGTTHLFHGGRFEPYDNGPARLPSVDRSPDWFRGQRDHLPFAEVLGATAGHDETATSPSFP